MRDACSSGKSTTIGLLLRFYDAMEGEVGASRLRLVPACLFACLHMDSFHVCVIA